MTTATYAVEGMTCGHCVASVKEEVAGVAGVRDVDVELATGALTVTSEEPLDVDAIRDAVEEAGYQLVGPRAVHERRVAAKLGAFVVVLAVVMGLGVAAGSLVGVSGAVADPEEAEHDMTTDQPTASEGHADGGHDAVAVGGLAISQDGYTFTPVSSFAPAGEEHDFRFTITGPDGQPVHDYTVEHDKELHLIVVRRDLTGFQHVHPVRDADGIWSIPLTLADAGEYRAFADFVPAGGSALTLGVDLHATGSYSPQPLPAPQRTAQVDGYTVDLAGDLIAGTASDLTLSVSRNGQPVTDLEPYLGAYGHLVALRDGDLAYLHVHPHGEPGDGSTPPGPDIAFAAEVPTAGTYRLFLDFQHGGVVRTAEFTVTAAE